MRILPFGDRGLLLEVGSDARVPEAVLALRARVAASRIPGVDDLVPGARTVLVHTAPGALADVRARLERLDPAPAETDAATAVSARVEVPIVYDGPDLDSTAELLGVSVEALVRRHAATDWTVAFTGFAPGFGYLVGDDWSFDVPRLPTPRTRVPAGAVGLAAGFCGAYPRATPGGWRLIGSTDAPLFDPDAADPVLLPPGTRVRFVERVHVEPVPVQDVEPVRVEPMPVQDVEPVRVEPVPVQDVEPVRVEPVLDVEPVQNSATSGAAGPIRADSGTRVAGLAEFWTGRVADPAMEVVEPGLLTTIQDLGRPGRAGQGIAGSGALDRGALRAANRLVGNREDAAALEVTMGGLRARARQDLWVAVTGGWGPIRIGGHEVDPYEAVRWPAGAELHLDWLAHGARAYLAVRGGIAAPEVAGSRATDTMARLGPAPLRAGDELSTGDAVSEPIPPAEPVMAVPPADELEIVLAPGPRADWFTPAARTVLFDTMWTVSDHADRVGIRLDGPAFERVRPGGEKPGEEKPGGEKPGGGKPGGGKPGRQQPGAELPSEGMLPGAIQVPPEGGPVILLADGPVTGGYPVIGVVTDAGLDLLAQARPGTGIRFRHARPL
ncbi:5-oxoprolinase/urea amidolyase family protein [Microbacterium sp.]|uniref:5-oxoprolinase/urea amidolyase family protein n=1 Tax=Microbacterium sp. TaxID=51671 RepID=UPI003A924689